MHCTSVSQLSVLNTEQQWRWGSKVGPGPSQIWRISGFVKSKTDGENGAVWSEKRGDLHRKKKVFTEIQTVFPDLRKKKGLQASHADFSVSFRWAPTRAHGPSAGLAEANGLPEAHGPPKVHGPRGHFPPCPPLGGPAEQTDYSYTFNSLHACYSEYRIKHLIVTSWINWLTASWWSIGNAFVSPAGGLRFKSSAGQIGHNAANGLPPLQHFFEKSCVTRRNHAEMRLVTLFSVIRKYNERSIWSCQECFCLWKGHATKCLAEPHWCGREQEKSVILTPSKEQIINHFTVGHCNCSVLSMGGASMFDLGERPNLNSYAMASSTIFEKRDFSRDKDTVEWRSGYKCIFSKIFKLRKRGEQTSVT